MKDTKIIKALECCLKIQGTCINCPYELCGNSDGKCADHLLVDVLNLINRQKAEIEEKTKKLREVLPVVAELKTEAIKEFAERLKEKKITHSFLFDMVCVQDIDNLVKEMMEENGNA